MCRVSTVLSHAAGDPLPVPFKGQLLCTNRTRIRFFDNLADALDVAALRGSVGHGTRGLVSMVRHAAGSSRMEHHVTLAVGLAGLRRSTRDHGAHPAYAFDRLAPDENGEMQRWGVEWGGAGALTGQGVTRDTLKPGDKVVITGNPGRNAADHRLRMRTLLRPSDGFGWGQRGETFD